MSLRPLPLPIGWFIFNIITLNNHMDVTSIMLLHKYFTRTNCTPRSTTNSDCRRRSEKFDNADILAF